MPTLAGVQLPQRRIGGTNMKKKEGDGSGKDFSLPQIC